MDANRLNTNIISSPSKQFDDSNYGQADSTERFISRNAENIGNAELGKALLLAPEIDPDIPLFCKGMKFLQATSPLVAVLREMRLLP